MRTGHSKIWYNSNNSQYNYIYGNYANAQYAETSQDFSVFKDYCPNTEFVNNLCVNSKSDFVALGSYDVQAANFKIHDNRFLSNASGRAIYVASSSASILIENNFFSSVTGNILQVGDSSKCTNEKTKDSLGVTFQNNTAGYDASINTWCAYNSCSSLTCSIASSDNTSTSDKFLPTDPSGWYDDNGYVDPGKWEYIPPINCSIAIDGSESNVALHLSATDSGSGMGSNARFPFRQGALMQFSNDGVTWSEVRVYSQSTSWTLPDGEGNKTIYARFRDRDGNWSQPVSASSIYVTISPPPNLKILKIYN